MVPPLLKWRTTMKWITNFQDARDIESKTKKFDTDHIVWIVSDPQLTKIYTIPEMKKAGIQGLYTEA